MDQLELFADSSRLNRTDNPRWEDVSKGDAHIVCRYEPCDKCAGSTYGYWNGKKCLHTADNYAYPKLQADGTCRRVYIEWNE